MHECHTWPGHHRVRSISVAMMRSHYAWAGAPRMPTACMRSCTTSHTLRLQCAWASCMDQGRSALQAWNVTTILRFWAQELQCVHALGSHTKLGTLADCCGLNAPCAICLAMCWVLPSSSLHFGDCLEQPAACHEQHALLCASADAARACAARLPHSQCHCRQVLLNHAHECADSRELSDMLLLPPALCPNTALLLCCCPFASAAMLP